MQFNNSKKRQRGATIIEMVVFIALGLIILGGAAAMIAKGQGSSDIGTDTANVSQLLVNVKDVRDINGYGADGTDLVPAMRASNGVPSNMPKDASDNPLNQWNGQITIVSSDSGQTFTLTSPSVPKDACIKEATKISRPGTLKTKINGTVFAPGQVSTSDATGACNTESNSLAFIGG